MDENKSRYILESFETALARGYIQPFYQPVIRTISGQLCSFEALARWIDPVYGMIRPDEFIPVLEEHKLIHLLDSHIIREVCRRIRHSVESEETPIPVSVNLSRLDFMLCDAFAMVDRHVRDFQIAHDFLYIEITESVMGETEGLMHTVVDRFHAAGYQVWMDDFGSGFSSLNMLKDYTFDEIKLDMCFLRSFDERSRRIMTAFIQMAKDIGIHTLTEGVETEEQYIYLRNVGCEKVQGYFFGKPLPYQDALENLRQKNIEIELPRNRLYYDDIGSVNFLSPSPFLTHKERRRDTTGRQLNSIPIALVEMCKEDFSILFCNAAFEQNAGTTILLPDIFRGDQFGLSHPYSMIPGRIVRLLESTRQSGEERMLFVSNEEYYELKAKCVARRKGAYSVLLQLNNLSQASQSDNTSILDEGLRQIYSIFERVSLLDLKNQTIMPLYSGLKSDAEKQLPQNLSEITSVVAEQLIFSDDQDAFTQFWNAEALQKRLDDSQRAAVSEYFRCRSGDGHYGWKQFIMLRYQPGLVLELVRDASQELERFNRSASAAGPSSAVSHETLFQNLLQTDILRIFWKDRDRRFLGANRGFLKYYGFKSEEEIVGKTDEDLGWHVHPDLYMNDEYRVINEGSTTYNVLGHCISRGVNRDILASKTPLFSWSGDIVGMLGCFHDRDALLENENVSVDLSRYDEMTGLLNERGLHEQAVAFQNEYFLRKTDFMFLYVSIDDIAEISAEYGFDFGDKVIAALGVNLKNAFGASSAVARVKGYQFAVIRQLYDRSEISAVRSTVKGVGDSIREIDGIHITLYLSLGYALFSESRDLETLAQSAEMQLLIDHDEHAPVENRQSASSGFFRLYDDLPIAYAVYKVTANREKKVTDAVLFYANHLFEKRAGKPLSQILGHSIRELFEGLDEKWFDIAERAALRGEAVTENIRFGQAGTMYHLTANQIIRPGFCCFTYQETELCNQSGSPPM